MKISLLLISYTWCVLICVLIPPGPVFGYEILMFGDSITQGLQRNANNYIYGIKSPPNGARINGSYGPRLENLLAQTEKSHAYNWGWLGERTQTAVGRINSVLATRQADYILILEGANDLLNGISMSSTKANLGILIDKSKKAGIEPILSEITPLSCPKKCGGEVLVDRLNDMVINLAFEKNVVISEILSPFYSGWNTVPYQSGDGIHISNKGYEVMANVWYDAILKAVRSKNGTNILFLVPQIPNK
ncbi:MAG: lysophospholipase L1-like esterase [Desulforhopalus sp.]|jgi:lysophospholipase L1-like esterase